MLFTSEFKPLETNPKILRATFDLPLFFHKLVTILVTFKSLISFRLTYAAPVWFPNTSQSSKAKLQTIRYSFFHIATGHVKMTNIDHLNTEAKTFKVDEHLKNQDAMLPPPGHFSAGQPCILPSSHC